jgi:hypothetical protein
VRQHDRRSVCDRMRMSAAGVAWRTYLGPILEGVSQAPLATLRFAEHYPERFGNASGNIDGENVCPTANPTR